MKPNVNNLNAETAARLAALANPAGLAGLRSDVERGLEVLSIVVEGDADVPRVLVVLRDPDGPNPDTAYHCVRYWKPVGGFWLVSRDGERVGKAGVDNWLVAPNATTPHVTKQQPIV